MIFVFHGENQTASRGELLKLKENYGESRFWEEDLTDLLSYLFSPSLFGKKELVILEDPNLKKLSKWDEIKARGGDKDVVLLFSRQLKPAELNKFGGAQIRIFREEIPKNVFPLLDAIAAREKKRAFQEARKLLKEGHDIDYLLRMLTWQLRGLARVKGEAFKGMNPYVVRKLKRFEKKWSGEDLCQAFSDLLSEDLRRKKGKKTPFDFLIDKLTS